MRNWEKSGKLKPDSISPGGTRRYNLDRIVAISGKEVPTGMNYYKKGLTNLINQILNDEVKRLVITHKDRLLRFGAELIFSICEAKEVEVVVINKGQEKASFEEDLAKDVLEIITVFSARLYGLNSKKNQKLIDNLSKAVNDNNSNLPQD